jgi:dienelactone hydrolase
MRRLLIALVCLVAPAMLNSAAHARVHEVDPWPDPASVTGVQTETVTLHSSDPFTPEDAGRAKPRDVTAQLYLPNGMSPDAPAPAVVLLHGSAGNAIERGERYGPALAAMGFAVMVVDTYASRPDLGDSYIARVLNITETMFDADAYAALRYLAARPGIDAHRVALAGFSYGGMAATYALYAQMADRLAPPGLRFAAHVAFYAPCIARFRDSRTTGAPLLMLYGQDDELMRAARCEQIAQDLRAGGSTVQIISYPGAVHQWDGPLAPRLIGRHLADCRFMVSRDGSVTDQNTLLPMDGPFMRKISLALCTGSRPYPIGRNAAVAAQSNHDFAAFLARVLAGGAPAPHS